MSKQKQTKDFESILLNFLDALGVFCITRCRYFRTDKPCAPAGAGCMFSDFHRLHSEPQLRSNFAEKLLGFSKPKPTS